MVFSIVDAMEFASFANSPFMFFIPEIMPAIVFDHAMTIQQEDLNFAYDTSISSSELGTVRKELSADIRNLELPDRMIVVELDSKKVGQGVEKPVTDAQKRSNARRTRFN